MAYLLIAFPQMTPTDDGKKRITSKSHGPHVLETIPAQHKKRRPKSIDVVQAKYPMNVKLELLTTLKCQSWGELCVPFF